MRNLRSAVVREGIWILRLIVIRLKILCKHRTGSLLQSSIERREIRKERTGGSHHESKASGEN